MREIQIMEKWHDYIVSSPLYKHCKPQTNLFQLFIAIMMTYLMDWITVYTHLKTGALQSSAFCEGLGNKYIRLCGPHTSPLHAHLCARYFETIERWEFILSSQAPEQTEAGLSQLSSGLPNYASLALVTLRFLWLIT